MPSFKPTTNQSNISHDRNNCQVIVQCSSYDNAIAEHASYARKRQKHYYDQENKNQGRYPQQKKSFHCEMRRNSTTSETVSSSWSNFDSCNESLSYDEDDQSYGWFVEIDNESENDLNTSSMQRCLTSVASTRDEEEIKKTNIYDTFIFDFEEDPLSTRRTTRTSAEEIIDFALCTF